MGPGTAGQKADVGGTHGRLHRVASALDVLYDGPFDDVNIESPTFIVLSST